MHAAAQLPQLVSGALSVRLYGISLCKPVVVNIELTRSSRMLVHAITPNTSYEFATDVRAGLARAGQKELPSKYLYDDVGSALFEVISHLPEYGLTRADERLLQRHSHDIVDRLAGPVAVAELGSGSGKKTRQILEALCSRQLPRYFPIEISRAPLLMYGRLLTALNCLTILSSH